MLQLSTAREIQIQDLKRFREVNSWQIVQVCLTDGLYTKCSESLGFNIIWSICLTCSNGLQPTCGPFWRNDFSFPPARDSNVVDSYREYQHFAEDNGRWCGDLAATRISSKKSLQLSALDYPPRWDPRISTLLMRELPRRAWTMKKHIQLPQKTRKRKTLQHNRLVWLDYITTQFYWLLQQDTASAGIL